MDRAVFQQADSPEDRREYRTWMRRMAVLYGILLVVGITFVATHRHPSGQGPGAIAAAPAASVVAGYQARH